VRGQCLPQGNPSQTTDNCFWHETLETVEAWLDNLKSSVSAKNELGFLFLMDEVFAILVEMCLLKTKKNHKLPVHHLLVE
jgi:hypothetical protein